MPEITVSVSNQAFRSLIINSLADEDYGYVAQLIIDLVEHIADDREELIRIAHIISEHLAEDKE